MQPPKYGGLIRELTYAIDLLGHVWTLETVQPADPHENNIAIDGRLQTIEQRLLGVQDQVNRRLTEIRAAVRLEELRARTPGAPAGGTLAAP